LDNKYTEYADAALMCVNLLSGLAGLSALFFWVALVWSR